MKTLVIGDAHVDDTQDLSRFSALGNLLLDRKPDTVIIIGDFLSLNCLSEWDRNKRAKMEGRRYKAEIDAGNRALDMAQSPIEAYNKVQRRKKKAEYRPLWVYIHGNHEYRLDRYLEHDPTFLGTVDLNNDLKLHTRRMHVVPYKDVYNHNGVCFTHIPINGAGKAIANPTVVQKALKLFSGSVVFGHTHTLDIACEHRHGSAHLSQALAVGCFFEHIDEYAVGSKTDYWRGLVMLDQYSHGRYDIETISMRQLKDKYGSPSST